MQDLKTLTIQELNQAIEKARSIVIVPHKNPDGDAVGCSLGLYHYLKEKGKSSHVVVHDPIPYFLDFLPDSNTILTMESRADECSKLLENADIIFCLDYSQLYRTGDVQSFIRSSKAIKVVIDHHPEPEDHFHFSYHQVAASSTCELVWLFIREMDPAYTFSINAASCLYTGLMTDTGCFRHALRPQTLVTAAELLKTGISYEYLVSQVFDTNTPERLKLIGFALNEKLKILPDFRTAFISISFEESEALGLKKGDTEGLVNYTLSIQNMVMGGFFHEREKGKTKISLRSKGNFAVNEISGTYFGGGGHKNAAGGEYVGSAEETVEKFMQILPQYKEALNSLEIGKRN